VEEQDMAWSNSAKKTTIFLLVTTDRWVQNPSGLKNISSKHLFIVITPHAVVSVQEIILGKMTYIFFIESLKSCKGQLAIIQIK
jgi:hypothetical protein